MSMSKSTSLSGELLLGRAWEEGRVDAKGSSGVSPPERVLGIDLQTWTWDMGHG